MNETPQISVVMGVRNGAADLAETMRSVLAQEGPSLEFVVVDDGSDDATPAMLADFTQVFLNRTRDEWEVRFGGTDACLSPVLSIGEAMRHPVNAARGVFIEHNGTMQAAPAPRFSATPGAVRPSAPVSPEQALAAWPKAG